METMTLTAPDISCDHCKRAIENSVGDLPGVQSCQVDVPARQVLVTYDPANVGRDTIVATMEEEGYPVAS